MDFSGHKWRFYDGRILLQTLLFLIFKPKTNWNYFLI